MYERTKRGGYPAELEHFAIAERFNATPHDVLYLWPVRLVQEARLIMRADKRYEDRHKHDK